MLNLQKKIIDFIEKLPTGNFVTFSHTFVSVDTKGRIIIEDCDNVHTFTDRLLIIQQGTLLITFSGTGLHLKSLSRHSAELVGNVGKIEIGHTGIR